METGIDFVPLNMLWNAALVTVTIGSSGYFIKRWMNKVEEDARQNRIELQNACEQHRIELQAFSGRLSEGLAKIYDQLRVANGRTSKIESGLAVQTAVCNERIKNGISCGNIPYSIRER